MYLNGLQLADGENVIKRYDFIVGKAVDGEEYETEDSLIITDNRVVRRVVNAKSFSQKEMVASDVNRIGASFQTNKYLSSQSTDPKKKIFMVLGILLLIIGLIIAGISDGATAKLVIGVVLLILGVVLIIIARKFKKVNNYREETVMTLSFYERTSDSCIISIEKAYDSKSTVMDIANEIGALLFQKVSVEDSSDSSKSEY